MGVNGRVIITIDVLAVSGLDAAQAAAFGRAIERTLTELVASGGLSPGDGQPRADLLLSGIAIQPNEPRQGGEAVARAIYRGLTP